MSNSVSVRLLSITVALLLALAASASADQFTWSPPLGPTLPQAPVDLGPTTPTISIKTASPADAQTVATRHGVELVRSFPWIDWYELTSPAGTTDGRDFARQVSSDPEVKATDAIAPGEHLLTQFTPRDTAWGPTLMLNTGEQLQWHFAKANFPAAWDRTTGKGVTIGIIDSEFDTTHPELSAKIRNPYNTSSGTANYHTGNTRATNVNQLHGTHVAGLAAASTDNGAGVSGAGFDALITPVQINTTFQPGTGNPVDANFVTDVTEALGYMAGQGVAVVNMSLGGTRNHQPLADAIASLRASGVTIVAAAGNFQQSSPNAPIYPASYPGVIAVANTQADNTLNPSSSNGNWVDIAAPGTNIVSTWDTADPQAAFNGEPGNYNAISGTSMASPIVAGLVALMKSVRADLTPDEVEALLKGTATDLGSSGPDPQFGSGLINAAAAVNAAAAYVRPVPPAPAPAPPPAAPADTIAPKVTTNGLVTVSGRVVTIRFKCNEACSGVVRVRGLDKKLRGSRKFSAKAGKTVVVRVTTKKKLKARSRVIVEVAAKDGAGNLSTQRVRRLLRN